MFRIIIEHIFFLKEYPNNSSKKGNSSLISKTEWLPVVVSPKSTPHDIFPHRENYDRKKDNRLIEYQDEDLFSTQRTNPFLWNDMNRFEKQLVSFN